MAMRAAALLLALLTLGCSGDGALAPTALAQRSGSLEGVVVSLPAGQRVSAALVATQGVSVRTRPDGSFRLEGVELGPCTVVASADGLGARAATVTVRQGPATAVNFVLGDDDPPTGVGAATKAGCDGSRGKIKSCGSRPGRFICNDGTVSCAENRQGACSGHGGVCADL